MISITCRACSAETSGCFARGQTFGYVRGALLPTVALAIEAGARVYIYIFRVNMTLHFIALATQRQIDAVGSPIVSGQVHRTTRGGDRNRVMRLIRGRMMAALMVVEPTLHVRNDAVAMVHENHGVVLGLDFDSAFSS